MNPIRRLARLLLFFTLSTLTRAADLPRVAVVPDSPEPSVAAFADFLSVSLASVSNQYALVERAELTRLASEAEIQKLAADQRPAALAKLAKADGLIIVGADKGDPKLPKLTLRLTSTNNGLVLRSLILGGKQDEYPKAAELAAGVLRFPCERLTHGDMKPPVIVSLLGIRPAFEIDRTLETTLNLAVAQQLSAQSGVAVSERWKMNDLVFERSLADEKPQSFATGTVLLDGSYTRKGDQLEFSLRLRKAESEAGKTLTLQGPATKPVELAQQIAKLVATESGQSGEAVAWNPLEEAKQYSELGWWLRVRAQGAESAQAYEAAVALGLTDRNVPRDRVWAYQSTLDDIDAIFYDPTWINRWLKLPKREFRQKLMTAIRMTQVAIAALDSDWGGLSQKDFDPSRRKLILTKTFDIDMKVLQGVCLRKEQMELATEARTLRALARELVDKSERYVENFAGDLVQRFYMHDTPADAAADLRCLLMPERMTNDHWSRGYWLRCNFWTTYQFTNLLRFVDWNSTDNRNGDDAWKRFSDELQGSNSLLHRADGLALAFQTSTDRRNREKVLQSYCDLLERNWDEFLTPQGQMCLNSFSYYFYGFFGRADKEQYPAFDLCMTRILTRVFESGKWAEPATLSMAGWLTRNWAGMAREGKPIVPEAPALSLLNAAENYIKWARTDPRWKRQYQSRNYGNVESSLEKLPERIILAYPNIKSRRVKDRPMVAGAVDIRAWRPEYASASARDAMLSSFYWVTNGDSLFVVSSNDGIMDFNVRSMTVSRVIGLPLKDAKTFRGITCNKDSLMVNMADRLFITPLSGDGKSWTEIDIPGVKVAEDDLRWWINGLGSDFFVGSMMRDAYGPSPNPRMLMGTVHDGRLAWQVSSNRRPAVHTLDETLPRNMRIAFQNAAGKTMVLLEQRFGRTTLTELETGREVCDLMPTGRAQTRGEVPLYWFGYDETIQLIAVFDPTQEKPRLLFKPNMPHLNFPETWKDEQPVYDNRRPEFLGTPIGVIGHSGKIWLLKREVDVAGQTERNDPQAFRLVRMDLNGGEPVVIPLRYQVPESIQLLGNGQPTESRCDLKRPIIDSRSLIATSKGLFFAPETDADLTPALFYITWDDINAWLMKNTPESTSPASP